MTLSKLIKKWSIERADGRAWIFFIFGICDWLPLNFRMHKHDKNQNLTNTLCRLCQSNTPETVEHLFNCPAFRDEQNDIRQGIDETLKKWSVPYTALGHLPGFTLKSQWIKMLQKKLSKNQKSLTLSNEKMQQMVEDYWTTNKSNRHKSFPHFWKGINRVLKKI
jgi:hypothetical protein